MEPTTPDPEVIAIRDHFKVALDRLIVYGEMFVARGDGGGDEDIRAIDYHPEAMGTLSTPFRLSLFDAQRFAAHAAMMIHSEEEIARSWWAMDLGSTIPVYMDAMITTWSRWGCIPQNYWESGVFFLGAMPWVGFDPPEDFPKHPNHSLRPAELFKLRCALRILSLPPRVTALPDVSRSPPPNARDLWD